MEQRSNSTTCWSKRNSKLESFLKRSLPAHIYNDIRYYTGCIVKVAKEALSYKYVIVTSQSLLFADNSCRYLQEAVGFPDILSINVECDYPYFLKGPEANSCQHIRLSCKKSKLSLKDVKEELACKSSDPPHENWQNINKHNKDSHVCTYHYLSGELNEFSSFKREDRDSNTMRKNTQLFMAPEHDEACNAKKNLYDLRYLGYIKFKYKNKQINLYAPESSSSSPEPESISSLLSRVETARPHIPRSRSSLAQHTSGHFNSLDIQSDVITQRSHSSLETSRIYCKGRTSTKDSTMLGSTQIQFLQKFDIHLYVLQGSPILLNHLQAGWFTSLTIATLELDGTKVNAKMSFCDMGQDFHQLKAIYQHFKRAFTDSTNSPNLSFQFLREFQAGLQHNPDIKRLFWKDQALFNIMVEKLNLFLLKPVSTVSCMCTQGEQSPELISSRQFELEFAALLLDILLNTLQGSDSISDKLEMLQLNDGTLLQGLLCLLVSAPTLPSGYNTTCARMLEDFREFSSCAWYNLPEAELIKLLADIINLSTAILYELFLTVTNLISGNTALKLPHLLEGMTLECHLKRSFTQILGILFPQPPRKLKPNEAVLIYHHFYVLKYLMENNQKVQEYVQQHFKEEFRYYIHWSRISHKLSDEYPVKHLLPPLIVKVHNLVTDH